MTQVSDQDWDALNAYHDGELSASETRAMAARLAREPELRLALDQIAEVSAGLRAIYPELRATPLETVPPAANSNRASWRWMTRTLAGGLVAAGLCAALLFGWHRPAAEQAYDVHSAYAQQGFDVDFQALVAVASTGSVAAPDLTATNLVSVAVGDFAGGTVAHYTGRNNCRLSYFRGPMPLSAIPDPEAQVASWVTPGGTHHGIIATGMDVDRFEATHAFLRVVTHEQDLPQAWAELERATEKAKPCIA